MTGYLPLNAQAGWQLEPRSLKRKYLSTLTSYKLHRRMRIYHCNDTIRSYRCITQTTLQRNLDLTSCGVRSNIHPTCILPLVGRPYVDPRKIVRKTPLNDFTGGAFPAEPYACMCGRWRASLKLNPGIYTYAHPYLLVHTNDSSNYKLGSSCRPRPNIFH